MRSLIRQSLHPKGSQLTNFCGVNKKSKDPDRKVSELRLPKAKTFYGSADVTPATAKMRLVTIAEEIIAVLSSDPNATVKVTVEIAADFPGGVSDQIKRAVSENASQLGFKNKTWD